MLTEAGRRAANRERLAVDDHRRADVGERPDVGHLAVDHDLTGGEVGVVAEFGDALVGGPERDVDARRERDPLGLRPFAEHGGELAPQGGVAVGELDRAGVVTAADASTRSGRPTSAQKRAQNLCSMAQNSTNRPSAVS